MDQGAVSSSDNRRDLIVGAPSTASIAGSVHIIFGGPDRSGEFNLANAEAVITSSQAGNRFGFATAAGNIRNIEGTTSRNLVVGAPGANGGRGAVYLFQAGFNTGARRTEADANYVIHGAPGDQLGTALSKGEGVSSVRERALCELRAGPNVSYRLGGLGIVPVSREGGPLTTLIPVDNTVGRARCQVGTYLGSLPPSMSVFGSPPSSDRTTMRALSHSLSWKAPASSSVYRRRRWDARTRGLRRILGPAGVRRWHRGRSPIPRRVGAAQQAQDAAGGGHASRVCLRLCGVRHIS
jgi:hypothetical protein